MYDVKLLKDAGLDAETIAKLVKAEEKKEFETKYKSLFSNPKVKALVELAKGLDFPVKVTIIGTGKHDQEPTLKISCPGKSIGAGRNGQTVKIGEKTYSSFKAVCDHYKLNVGAASAHDILDRAIASGAVQIQYSLVAA